MNANKKRNLFFGFDDTIVPIKNLMADYISNKYGIRAREEDCDIYNFCQTINQTSPKIKMSYSDLYLNFGMNFFSSFNLKNDFRLFDGAKEIIPLLSEAYNLYIVSTRRSSEKGFMSEILQNNGVFEYFSKIYCFRDYTNNSYRGLNKIDFIKNIDKTNVAFIDSSIKDIEKTRNIIDSFLFDPKNFYKNETEIERFSNWEQIGKTFSQ